MNGDIIAALIVVAAALITIRGIMRLAKGKGGCCGCPDSENCHKEETSCSC